MYSLASIQSTNLLMIEQKAYRDMKAYDPTHANSRYTFLSRDASTLYRMYHKNQGVNVTYRPEQNVHHWLDPSSPAFKPDLHRAVFYYQARLAKEDRFKICISTPEMDDAAWRFAHHNQLILDGTFGVCSSRLLLFIAMGIDTAGRGPPLALFLFSAPTGNRATHAGYNRSILRELLDQWRTHLSKRHASSPFAPYVAITDTDTKERGALQDVWPSIWLLLCKFHVRQCWTNRRKTLKLASSKGSGEQFWNHHVHSRLQNLEVQCVYILPYAYHMVDALHHRLLNTVVYANATKLLADEECNMMAIMQHGPSAQAAAKSGMAFLAYMQSTWMPESLWQGWSQKGRSVAATLLNIPIEGVLPTTNHLESFNGLLKRKYIHRWQRAGARLRFDFLINILATRILPEIFTLRRSQQKYDTWLSMRFNIDKCRQHAVESDGPTTRLYFCVSDTKRDEAALAIFHLHRIYNIKVPNFDIIEAMCAASSASLQDLHHSQYSLWIHRAGLAHCTCPDFTSNGGACKHLRALRLVVDEWVTQRLVPAFYHPTSLDDARRVLSLFLEPTNATMVQHTTTQHTTCLLTNITALRQVAVHEHCDDALSEASSITDSSGIDTIGDDNDSQVSENGGDTVKVSTPSFPSSKVIYTTRQDLISIGLEAVATQNIQHINHTVSALLPRLYSLDLLSSDSSDSSRLTTTPPLTKFHSVIKSLCTRLDSTSLSANTSTIAMPTDITPTDTPPEPRRQPMKRNHDILPPSPEPKQKRKVSHGVM